MNFGICEVELTIRQFWQWQPWVMTCEWPDKALNSTDWADIWTQDSDWQFLSCDSHHEASSLRCPLHPRGPQPRAQPSQVTLATIIIIINHHITFINIVCRPPVRRVFPRANATAVSNDYFVSIRPYRNSLSRLVTPCFWPPTSRAATLRLVDPWHLWTGASSK